jgi:tetratricopeptide (TPR) repeat protein
MLLSAAPVIEGHPEHPLDRERVAALLDEARRLIRSDPGQAGQAAARCIAAAETLAAYDLAAGAHYLAARALAANAEYDRAIAHIARARAGYLAAGDPFEALRTNVGLMTVLSEQGRFQDALDAGHATVAELAALGPDVCPDDVRYVTALVQQNAGICYSETGRYDAALHAYRAAEAAFRELGMAQQIGDVSNNRGIVLLGLGRPTEALEAFERSAAIFADAELTGSHAVTLLNIGNAHLLQGHFARSLEAFEAARSRFAAIDARADAHVLTLDTGDAYLALNRYPEALAAYAEAAEALREAGMPRDRARALWGAGAALIALGRLDEAAGALDEAAALCGAVAHGPLLSSVLLEQAALQDRRGDRRAARALAERARALVDGGDWPVQRCYAHLRLADLGEDAAAEAHLLAARALADDLGIPHLVFRLRQRLGRLRLRQQRTAEARALLEAAAEQIEGLRGALATESLRVSFLQDKVAVYDDLLLLQLQCDADPWAALALAERARARALVDRLVGGGRAAGAHPDALAALHDDLNATYAELLGHGAAPPCPARAAALRARAAELERAVALADLRSAAAAGSDHLAAPLAPDELRERLCGAPPILAYHIVADEIIAFVIAGGQVAIVRGLGQARLIEPLIARLASQIERLAADPAFVARNLPILERSANRILGDLYAQLVGPVAHLLARIPGAAPRRLLVAPHGLLHQVPFHALHDGERPLLDTFELSYAPSVAAVALAPREHPRPARPPLVVGVADPSIPHVAEEVAAIAELLPGAVTLAGPAATVAAVRRQAPGSAVLHLACHGVFRADNPAFSSLRLGDGWLAAAEVGRLDLRGALVALSACESGRGRVYDGDEVIGLTRAFLGAGARAVLVSLWLAQDAATAALMRGWYGAMAAGHSPAAALRLAQLAVRAQSPHPSYWAPFFLVGPA